jgi:hypothetical protein
MGIVDLDAVMQNVLNFNAAIKLSAGDRTVSFFVRSSSTATT